MSQSDVIKVIKLGKHASTPSFPKQIVITMEIPDDIAHVQDNVFDEWKNIVLHKILEDKRYEVQEAADVLLHEHPITISDEPEKYGIQFSTSLHAEMMCDVSFVSMNGVYHPNIQK